MGFWAGVLVGMGFIVPIFVAYRIYSSRKDKNEDAKRLRAMRAKYTENGID